MALRPHADTPEAVEFLWTSDQPDAKSPDNTQQSQRHPTSRRDSNPQSPVSKRPQTDALDGAVTGTDINILEYGI